MALLGCWRLDFLAKLYPFPCFKQIFLSLAMATSAAYLVWTWAFSRAQAPAWQRHSGCGNSNGCSWGHTQGCRGTAEPSRGWQQTGGEQTSCFGDWQRREERNWFSSPPEKFVSWSWTSFQEAKWFLDTDLSKSSHSEHCWKCWKWWLFRKKNPLKTILKIRNVSALVIMADEQ